MLVGLISILTSNRFHLFLTLIIYYFMPNSWTLFVWFYVFLLANAWDILSTYTFVYIYGDGWEIEKNDLIHWFAKHTNYHWAIVLQTLTVCVPVILFCVLWPWSEFSMCVLMFLSVGIFITGTLNFLTPFMGSSVDSTYYD